MRSFLLLLAVTFFGTLQAAEEPTPTLEQTKEWLVEKRVIQDAAELATLTELGLNNREVNDDELRYLIPLCGMKSIVAIDLRGNNVTGSGFTRLARECKTFESITGLDLFGNTRFNDAGVASLAVFPNLQVLNLDDLKITGEGFRNVSLPKLQQLWLVGCPLTAEGLKTIAKMDSIALLQLGRTEIDDEGLKLLNRRVTKLELGVTKITEKGLAYLAENFELVSLNVGHTGIRWDGLKASLPRFKKLKMLSIAGLQLKAHVSELVELLEPLEVEMLYVNTNGLTGNELLPFAKLSKLKHLGVFDFDFGAGDKNLVIPADVKAFEARRKELKLPAVNVSF